MKTTPFRQGASSLPATQIPVGSSARQEPLFCSGRRAGACSVWRWLVLSMALTLALGCTGCGAGGASAASMFLRKTEGTVAVSDAGGAEVVPEENLSLYSGYTVGTGEESYAWIDLDKVKLAKLDADSAAEIAKDGKNLTIDVTSGSMFFHVTEPLADDETMDISTSSMLVGIRGTCGWVTQNSAALLEGTVTVTAGEESVTIAAGEQARLMQDGALQVSALTFSSIPAFVARELLDDDALQQTVLEASGLYIPTTYEELLSALGETLSDGEIVFSEEIDFEQDGSPEFLVIGLGNSGGSHEDFADEGHYPYRRIWFTIYRNSAEGIRGVIGKPPVIALGMFSQSCSLAERDGRLFLKCTGESATTGTFEEYFGSVAERDGGWDDWGMTDYIHDGRVSIINEKGFVDDANNNRHIWGEELQAYLNRYTTVRELYRADGIDVE